MNRTVAASGLFICEGTSDEPLAEIVERIFVERGCNLRLTVPPFDTLKGVAKDVRSRVDAGLKLIGHSVDLVIVHRDADNAGWQARYHEISNAVAGVSPGSLMIPIIPISMTEAWLLLDEGKIRFVSGKPSGKSRLKLPKVHEVEGVSDPKDLLKEALLTASESTGRRRKTVAQRFGQHRRQLLQNLDVNGPVKDLSAWKLLSDRIDEVLREIKARGEA